jgi:DNA-binding transcriptional LysR family regulator
MKLDLHRLRHIVTVAETRSFSRAAELLSITQPALSRSIATLEEDLGLRIFDRGRGGVFITQAGRELVEGAERLLAQARLLEQNVLQSRTAGTGIIRFGMAPMLAGIFLPRLLGQIAKAYPDLSLRPIVRKADELITALTAGQVELCFIAANYLSALDHIGVDVIGTVPIGVFARAGHPLLGKKGLHSHDLRGFPFAASAVEFPGQRGEPPLIPSIVCDNYFLMKELMLTSDTVCVMSPLLLHDELRQGTVWELDVNLIDHTGFDICSIRLINRTESASARLVLDHFVKIVQQPG